MADEDERLTAAWLTAAADQLDARHRDRKNELRRELEQGPSGDRVEKPVRLWQEGDVWCAVVVGPIGALCGYARLPDGHPWAGLHYDEDVPDPKPLDLEQPTEQAMDDHGVVPIVMNALAGTVNEYERTLQAQVQVHGGLTWSGPMPIEGAPHGWWLGFDCGHDGDAPDPKHMTDQQRELHEQMPPAIYEDAHIWTEEEVAMEIKRMVPAITEAMGDKRN